MKEITLNIAPEEAMKIALEEISPPNGAVLVEDERRLIGVFAVFEFERQERWLEAKKAEDRLKEMYDGMFQEEENNEL